MVTITETFAVGSTIIVDFHMDPDKSRTLFWNRTHNRYLDVYIGDVFIVTKQFNHDIEIVSANGELWLMLKVTALNWSRILND